MNKKDFKFLLTGIFSLFAIFLVGQSILVDEGIRVNDIWCFPILGDENHYKYLPNEVVLAQVNDKPQFSYLKYVINTTGSKETTDAITKATGGAIVNFIVEFKSNEEKIKQAESQLKSKYGKEKIITGPIIPEKATFLLVSSILNGQEKKLIGWSDAPVLEGGRIPASFRLSEEDATLLLESFKMTTPDISILFDFTFKGLTQAFDGQINYNWSQIYKYTRSKKRFGVPFFKVNVDKLNEELKEKNYIEVINNGSNEQMEQLQQAAYERITNMLFKPANLNEFRIDQKKTWVKDLIGVADHVLDRLNNSTLGIMSAGFSSGYQLRNIKKEGSGSIVFKGRSDTERHHFLTFNIGDIYKQYGEDTTVFNVVNLKDYDFLQREIYIGVDGSLAKEFENILNNVTITFRKTHDNGEISTEQKLLKKSSGDNLTDIPKIIYPNLGDSDLLDWMNYEYKSTWYFQGGATLEQPWKSTNAAMINLYTPFEKRKIYLNGKLEKLWEKGIKSVVVEIDYDFFGKRDTVTQIIQEGDNLSEKSMKITYPRGTYQSNFKVVWFTDDAPIEWTGTDKYGIIFIDKPIINKTRNEE